VKMSKTINRLAVNASVEVISNKRVGAYHLLLLSVGDLARAVRPGNFIAIAVGDADGSSSMLLRRSFAISRAIDKGGDGGILELVISPVGKGSRWLAERKEGDQLNVIAPLGTSFGIPKSPARALLVGGGYGSAPLFGLSEHLKSRGCRTDMILGASTAMKIYAPLEGKRSVSSLTVTTEDGSAGIRGRVTDVMREIIRDNEAEIIYSCGPMGMLEAVHKIAQEYDLVHQCAVEESMACGIGICMTCVLPVRGEDGIIRMLRTCIDGPVLDGETVVFGSHRQIPTGTWGAQ
jgi:dihydroorotate dehydrogenase electron transfer subunit